MVVHLAERSAAVAESLVCGSPEILVTRAETRRSGIPVLNIFEEWNGGGIVVLSLSSEF